MEKPYKQFKPSLLTYNRSIIYCFFNKLYLSQSQANKIKLSNGRVVTVLAQSSFLTGFRRHLAAQEKKKIRGGVDSIN